MLILFSTFYEDCYEVNDLMDRLRISDLRDRYYHELSGGMKQRVNLALAFLNKPSIVILDEPTTGLDPFARREFWNNLKDMARNTTVFLSSHYMEEIQQNCDSLIFLNKGDLIYSGAMSKLLSKYDKPDLEEIYMKTIGGK